jgi:anti-sigma regulatory factor (Ser/Thr protein kinase)
MFDDGCGRVLRLASGAHCVRDARRFVCEVVAQWGVTHPEDAALLTSEVVTNAFRHAGGEIVVRVRRDGSHALIEVHDHNPTPPKVQRPDRHRRGGNGLRIVDALASSWGVTQLHGGKIVWFEIPLQS